MMVSTRAIFLILLLPLVQGANSGNRNPGQPPTLTLPPLTDGADSHHHSLAPMPPSSLGPPTNPNQYAQLLVQMDIDRGAIVLPMGSTYGIAQVPIVTPIPADNYYRVPFVVVVKTPRGDNKALKKTRVVRLKDARISIQDLHIASEIPMLQIQQFLTNIEVNPNNDRLFEAFLLPPWSTYHLDTNVIEIGSDKYIQLPPKANAFTLVGTYYIPGQVIRSVEKTFIQVQTLRSYDALCKASYEKLVDKVKVPGYEGPTKDDKFVERCTKGMWYSVLMSGNPFVRFSPPRSLMPSVV